jgi:hypothetical protein
VRGHAGEGAAALLEIEEERVSEAFVAVLARRDDPDEVRPGRYRERTPKQRLGQAEDRHVGADTNRQQQHDDGGARRVAPHHPQREPRVLAQRLRLFDRCAP